MDAETRKILRGILGMLIGIDEQLLETIAAVTVLKVAVGHLEGEDPERALALFREAEQKALKEAPVAQRLKEARELLEFFEKHGDDFGKTPA